MKLNSFVSLPRSSWIQIQREKLFPSPVHKLLAGTISVTSVLFLSMSVIVICVKLSTPRDFLLHHCILNGQTSNATISYIHRLVLRLSTSLTMLLVMLFAMTTSAYITQNTTITKEETDKRTKENFIGEEVTGEKCTEEKITEKEDGAPPEPQAPGGESCSTDGPIHGAVGGGEVLYDILSSFSLGLRVTAIVVLGAIAVRSPSLTIVIAPIWGLLGLLTVILCDCSATTVLHGFLLSVLVPWALHNRDLLSSILPTSSLSEPYHEFLSSELAANLTSRPLGFLSDILLNSLTSFLCLESDMFLATAAAATLTMMYIATCLLVAGLRSRKYFEAVYKSRQSDRNALTQALQECATIIGDERKAAT